MLNIVKRVLSWLGTRRSLSQDIYVDLRKVNPTFWEESENAEHQRFVSERDSRFRP